ncbi:uncharacterized protein [Gossypium hirsutum]|uniref:RNase H type-1 domain-containing protein n=1 Tax=Gossypium hirsutum TaxID=3635 RepID=A0A1U8MXF8_GOSHI|nr:uncharacterized protein LOC107942376 [Gossypium hirsutum]
MSILITDNQTSFVGGRCIMDNVVIAQEVIYSMGMKKREERLGVGEDRYGESIRLDLAEWVHSNLSGEFQVGFGGDESRIYFAVIEKVEEMVSSTKCFAEHVIETSPKGSRTRDSQVDMERWCLPNHGWIKINTDGAASRNKNWLVDGGLLRDSFGNWIEGFQRSVKRGFAVNSELWAILHRLEIAETRGYTKVIVEFDCKVVVDMIKECSESTPSMTIVRKIKEVTR